MSSRLLQIIKSTSAALASAPPAEQGEVTILKADAASRMVWGWASVSTEQGKEVVDTHGDIVETITLVKAAHDFMDHARAGKVNHGGPRTGKVVESLVFTAALQKALGIDLGMEGWLIGYKVEDDATWSQVQAGKLGSFSFGGTALRRKSSP